MNNTFRQLHEDETPPLESKRAILDEIRTYEMLADIIELFTGSFVRASIDIFDIPEAARKKNTNKNR